MRTELNELIQVIIDSISGVRAIGNKSVDLLQSRGINYYSKYSKLAEQIRNVCLNTSTIHEDILNELRPIETELNTFSRRGTLLTLQEENDIMGKLENTLKTTKARLDKIEGRISA